MDSVAQWVGLTGPELTQLLILAAVLLVGLFALRLFLRLTAALFRLGCVGILVVVAVVYLLNVVGG